MMRGRMENTHNEKWNTKKTCDFTAKRHRDKNNLCPSMPGSIGKSVCGSTDAQVPIHFDEEDLNSEDTDIRGTAQIHWIEIQRCSPHRRRIAHNTERCSSWAWCSKRAAVCERAILGGWCSTCCSGASRRGIRNSKGAKRARVLERNVICHVPSCLLYPSASCPVPVSLGPAD